MSTKKDVVIELRPDNGGKDNVVFETDENIKLKGFISISEKNGFDE